jgi:hypothetical protein
LTLLKKKKYNEKKGNPMEKIEINTSEPEKVIPILRDAIERQKRILSQSLAQTQERIQQLATQLKVNPDLLLAGEIPHPEDQDMDLLELEGELEIIRHLREQLESLEKLTICP